jgi:hypothetical protein
MKLRCMNRSAIPLLATLIVASTLFGLLTYLAITGWPGEIGASGTEFCEAMRSGPVKQPINTWSNLGFVLVAVMIAAQAKLDLAREASTKSGNPLVSSTSFTTTYSLTAVLIGAGSGALHASTTEWGARVDVYAMFVWAAWVASYSAMRLIGSRGVMAFLCCFAPLVTLLAIKVFAPIRFASFSNSDLFGMLVASGIVLELIACYVRRKSFTTDLGYLGWAVACFLAGYLVWFQSRTGRSLCCPTSLWQGHALWHILCACSVGFVYLYGRSEQTAAV